MKFAFLLLFPSLSFAGLKLKVKIEVQSPINKELISSYLSRELRKLPDVDLYDWTTNNGDDYFYLIKVMEHAEVDCNGKSRSVVSTIFSEVPKWAPFVGQIRDTTFENFVADNKIQMDSVKLSELKSKRDNSRRDWAKTTLQGAEILHRIFLVTREKNELEEYFKDMVGKFDSGILADARNWRTIKWEELKNKK